MPDTPSAETTVDRPLMANAIRALAMDAVERAQSGHPGMPMGMADVATVLMTRFLRFDPDWPDWPGRDRLVLSAGHGSMLLYALLYLTGYPRPTIDDLKRFRQLDSPTAGHPEYGDMPGIETTTGPLGQGFANAVGMALAERLEAARNPEIAGHRTVVIASDGDLMEGISHEAASLAGHLGLSKLLVLYDDNAISIDGSTALAFSDDTVKRFHAYGWYAEAVDGHDHRAIEAAIDAAIAADRPALIACRTTIAYGASAKAGTAEAHGAPLGDDEIGEVRRRLGWQHAPFEIPEPVLEAWREAGRRGKAEAQSWRADYEALPRARRRDFDRRQAGDLPGGFAEAIRAHKRALVDEPKSIATRKASKAVLEAITPELAEMIGGSADLSGSNNTKAGGMDVIAAAEYAGRYIHYGVREHAMAACMNGMALHGGFLPYGGTFLIFSDYCRPAIRLAALMRQRVVFVMTHDSIGLGEDGPTHQPIEQLPGLRAMPNLLVFRPCDAVETAECWQAALEQPETPSVLALSRQKVAPSRLEDQDENLAARGGYILHEAASGAPRVILLATGSEVALAVSARRRLEDEHGVATRVVSMPCRELFDRQPPGYVDEVLGEGLDPVLRVSVEAASPFGWERYLGRKGLTIGMTRFGESAPSEDLFAHFGFTPEAVVAAVRDHL